MALVAATPVVLALAVSLGAVRLPLGEVWSSVLAHTVGGLGLGLGRGEPSARVDDQIIWQVRVPRVLLAFIVGAGLAVAGATLQAVIRNPLADPYVLGVSSGASLAAVAALTLGGVGWLAHLGVSGAAFAGGLLTLGAVLLLGRRAGRIEPGRLLLAGVALGYLLQAATSYLQLRVSSNQLAHLLFWLLGTVSGADWRKLGLPAAIVAACTIWLVLRGRALNALLLGDDLAASAGVAVSRLRTELLVIAALLTGTVIAVAGGVQFVGLVAPHCVRLLVGADHRRLLPLSALLGGNFLVLADLAARTVSEPLELPLTIVTAVVGVPFFLVLLRRGTPTGTP
ncbi:iron ABC transporter permease [Parafrankia sp. BMG5.11]|uniref:FecCD family ABC transporter permease n=1 Tax=Parafrankia sp. BMG5.11 TaxID=222540 RepID=UPI00103EA60E|nr:iron ABC transporter permease [Parafrankia sp. BMG5.11]TCJ34600.1 iron ABC transporter permease [Parafrankia sp. BMG5.11]